MVPAATAAVKGCAPLSPQARLACSHADSGLLHACACARKLHVTEKELYATQEELYLTQDKLHVTAFVLLSKTMQLHCASKQ